MVLQHAQSSARTPWQGLDPTRIVATSGALALNIVILLLLLVPATRLVPQAEDIVIQLQPDQKKEIPPTPPPPVEHAKIEKKAPEKVIPVPAPQPLVDVPPVDTSVVIPEGTLPATETEAVPTASAETSLSSGPIAGVTLEYAHAPPPHYTRDLLVARLEGTVYLQVLVDVDGKPIEVSIHKSSGERRLDEAARRFVLKNWTFRPAMKDGHAVQAIGIVPIDYRLE